ncbi:MAG: pyruvate dehydrogenase (acetyl-transferring) E1 component subunit alpha [Planctomycetota bacterium]
MTAMQTKTKPSGPSASLPDETLIEWLRQMVLIREFELRTMAAYQQAKIGGFCHIYIGQEPVVVGTFAAVDHEDPIITAYRDHGHALARGMDPKACMAEMYGRISGCAKGKGGSMHMFDKPNHLYGGHGIVGAQTPVGAGLAFAAKYEREVMGKSDRKRLCLCYLGDGALNQGAFHEACNLAGLFDIPVIYVLENNGYSMGTHIARGTTMADDLSTKAKAYGMDYLEVDGMDARVIYDAFKPWADDLRERSRPGFANIKCYRYQGHSMSDPQKYRTKEEVAGAQERDGIDALAHHLLSERECLTEEQFKAIQKEAKNLSKEAIQFAESEPDPQPEEELYSDVYVNPQPNLSSIQDYHEGAKNPLL